jgi:hypothetical protein
MESLLRNLIVVLVSQAGFPVDGSKENKAGSFLEWKPPPFAGWGQIRDGERLPDYALHRPTPSMRKSDQRFVFWMRHTGCCQYSDVKPVNIGKA